MQAAVETERGQESSKNARRRLQTAVGIYYRSLLWTLAWCRQVKAGVPEKEIDGFFLNTGEMGLLGLNLGHVLWEISENTHRGALRAGPPLDYWARAIRRFAYRESEDELQWSIPGDAAAKGCIIERVQFHANPVHLPFSDVHEAIRRCGRPMGFEPAALLFSYEGVTIENASCLADIVKTLGRRSPDVGEALLEWRDRTFAHIVSQKVRTEDDSVWVDPRLKGLVLARPQLAKFLRKSPRTLKNWDKRGYVPTGVKWHSPEKVSGNLALYEVSRNWPAIQSMMPCERDRDTDRQLAAELLGMKHQSNR